MSKLFQIYEHDLAVLEKELPQIAISTDDPQQQSRLGAIRLILSNVRWNYGPHSNVETIAVDDQPPQV